SGDRGVKSRSHLGGWGAGPAFSSLREALMAGSTPSSVQFAVINQAATATLVAAQPAGTTIRVVSLFLVNTAAQTLTFKSGAGGTALTGAMALAANGVLVLPYCPQGYF